MARYRSANDIDVGPARGRGWQKGCERGTRVLPGVTVGGIGVDNAETAASIVDRLVPCAPGSPWLAAKALRIPRPLG